MIVLIGFAFLSGVITILSPCILPILPIVLSGSVTGGKHRPTGIIVGFIASFTFFTLFLTTIVRMLNISADVLRMVSVVIIFIFGLSLLIPRFQAFIEHLFSKLANTRSAQGEQIERRGFGGGILIGLSLGLIWTPCVGPILASVISLALTGSVTGSAALITLAYSAGTAIPMFGIAHGGRALLQKAPWLLRNTGTIQKLFGALMILVALGIHFNVDRTFQAYVIEQFPQYGAGLTRLEENAFVKDSLDERGDPLKQTSPQPFDQSENASERYSIAPEIIPGGTWFNSQPLTLKNLRGNVVLVDFWTYTCINCIRTLPYLRSWDDAYRDDGLVILGIHAPEFEFEKNAKNVAKAIQDFNLQYPVVQDNDFATWRAYDNRYWPAKYLIDKDGFVRYTHFGEGAYDETEAMIQTLLNESGSVVTKDIQNPQYEVLSSTPELYLGFVRTQQLVSPETIGQNIAMQYTAPKQLPRNTFAFEGAWTITEEYAAPLEKSRLLLNFESKEVFLVMRPKDIKTPGTIRVFLNGNGITHEESGTSKISVNTDRLYALVRLSEAGRHTLTIEFLDSNIELYAFTFG